MTQPSIDILYEEGPCLAVLKPPGLLTQASPGIDSLEVRVKSFLKHRDNKPGNVYLGVPHRLDRPASGVLLLARHVRAARRLSEQFAGRLVGKTYWALVEGLVQPDRETWTDYIRKIPGQPQAELVDKHHPEGKLAVLHHRVLWRSCPTATDPITGGSPRGEKVGEGAGSANGTVDGGLPSVATLLEIVLETGRTHQVRVQSAARGHPILGDRQYGCDQTFGPETDDWRLRAIALHARRIEFRHPMTRENVSVVARPPDFWPAPSALIGRSDLGRDGDE